MTTVKMLVHMQGTGCERKVGHEYEVDEAEAKRLIEAGFAVGLEAEDEPEDEPKPKDEAKAKRGRKPKPPVENPEQNGTGSPETPAQ